MLNALIRFSLGNRPLVLGLALLLLMLGFQTARVLPVEVLPDMTKPTVTILTECAGLAPEEVEVSVSQPIESAIQGVGGLDRLRSNSDVGLSLVFAEFDWCTAPGRRCASSPASWCRSGCSRCEDLCRPKPCRG